MEQAPTAVSASVGFVTCEHALRPEGCLVRAVKLGFRQTKMILVVAGQPHCDCKEHSPGDELHPAAGCQPACMCDSPYWLRVGFCHLQMCLLGKTHLLGAKASVIKLENKPHVVEWLSGICELKELADTKTSTSLTQASVSLLRADLYLHPARPRRDLPALEQLEIMVGQPTCTISFRFMSNVSPPSQDPTSVIRSQWAGVTLVEVFLPTGTKEGVV